MRDLINPNHFQTNPTSIPQPIRAARSTDKMGVALVAARRAI
jgi:hypothetical protein